MTSCKNPDICKNLFAYAQGKLAPEQAERVSEVVASCEMCQKLLLGYDNVLRSIDIYQTPLNEKVTFPASPFPTAPAKEKPSLDEVEFSPRMLQPVSNTSVLHAQEDVPEIQGLPPRVTSESNYPIFRPRGLVRHIQPKHYNLVFHTLGVGFLLSVLGLGVLLGVFASDSSGRNPLRGLGRHDKIVLSANMVDQAMGLQLIMPQDIDYTSLLRYQVLGADGVSLAQGIVNQPLLQVPPFTGDRVTVLLEDQDRDVVLRLAVVVRSEQ